MAEQTKYTIEEVIALPKGTTPWYDQNQDAYRHIKNTMDTIADISGGGEPGLARLLTLEDTYKTQATQPKSTQALPDQRLRQATICPQVMQSSLMLIDQTREPQH